jgi:Zn-dependent alcohol dehydrogenase
MGVVEEVGADVRAVRPGDAVLAPFAYSDGSAPPSWRRVTTRSRRYAG